MFSKSQPIANRLHPKMNSLKLKIPTSPESDGEIYLTPNTSVIDDDKRNNLNDESNDAVFVEHLRPPPRSKNNGYRVDKIHSMSSIANNNNNNNDINNTNNNHNNHHNQRHTTDDRLIEQQMYYDNKTNGSEGQNMFRINSLGNLSQYERDYSSKPKSLLKLREEFERRRVALVAQRNSLNLMKSNDAAANGIEQNGENGIFKRAHKKRFGIGDTKYIGTENDTPEAKQYSLTKIKSMGTISDPTNANDCVTYDAFLTPNIPRRHPSSLHSFEEEEDIHNNFNSDSNGSSDEQENFLRRNHGDEQADFMHETNLLRGSFERGFRRSFNKNHERMTVPAASTAAPPTVTGLRKSDGCFKIPQQPIDKQQFQANERKRQQQKNRSSVHSLPSDGKCDVTRYDVTQNKKTNR